MPGSWQSDTALMTSVQAGGRAALGELYERLALRAYRTALAVCHDRDCAQDAVQDAFLSMWSSRSTYNASRGPVSGWAMSIVRHRAIYITRRRTLTARRNLILAHEEEQYRRSTSRLRSPCRTRATRRTPLAAAQRATRGHPLGFSDGLTHQQIASRLALPTGTVKGRMQLGLKKLHDDLDPEGR